MGGGAGTASTRSPTRAKPAVPLAGYYRLIDIPISNCINSGINRIFVLTQFNTVSLHRHVTRTYQFDTFSGGYVRILAAEQTPSSARAGTRAPQMPFASSCSNFRSPRHTTSSSLLAITYTGEDYRSSFSTMRATRPTSRLQRSLSAPRTHPELGILKADADGRITEWVEEALSGNALTSPASKEITPTLQSMGIYVFGTPTLVKLLRDETGSDFGKHIIPAAIEKGLRVVVYPFDGYWEDIGTIRAFYEVNLALASPNPPFDFFAPEWPIYTHARYLSGSRVMDSSIRRVVLAPGCRIDNASVADSVIGLRSIVNPGAHLHRVVMMGADYYETMAQIEEDKHLGLPPFGVGEGSVIENAILDKNVRIGKNVVIRNHDWSPDEETETYVVRDGLVVVPKGAVIPDNTVI